MDIGNFKRRKNRLWQASKLEELKAEGKKETGLLQKLNEEYMQ